MAKPESVHFGGSWTHEERRLIESAISDARSAQEVISLSEEAWICLCVQLDGRWQYLTCALSSSCVLTSKSVQGLADKICQHLSSAPKENTRLEPRSGLPPVRLRRVLGYIHNHLDGDLTVTKLASVLSTSKDHFARQFKIAMRESPHQYVMRCRMKEAKRLLGETDMTVSEVSRSVGYQDHSHFASIFRRYTQKSPLEYRNSLPV